MISGTTQALELTFAFRHMGTFVASKLDGAHLVSVEGRAVFSNVEVGGCYFAIARPYRGEKKEAVVRCNIPRHLTGVSLATYAAESLSKALKDLEAETEKLRVTHIIGRRKDVAPKTWNLRKLRHRPIPTPSEEKAKVIALGTTR
jgi:hypothetical protein